MRLAAGSTASAGPGKSGGQHRSALLIYADNNNHVGIQRDVLADEQKQMIDSLHAHGLETHELTDPMTLAESLGVRINGSTGQVGQLQRETGVWTGLWKDWLFVDPLFLGRSWRLWLVI